MKLYTETDAARWNEVVDRSVNKTIFHKWEWLKIAEKHSKSKLYPLVFLDDGEIPFGVFPLFYSRRGPLRMVFSPPPGCAMELGPLLALGNDLKQHKLEYLYKGFQEEIDRFIKGLGANYVFITSSPGLLDVRPFIWAGYSAAPSYTYKIDLNQGESGVWSSFPKKLRSDITRTEKKGLVVKQGLEEYLSFLYNSVDRRYRDQNMRLTLSKEYLTDLFGQFGPSNLTVFSGIYEEKVLGAIVHLTCYDTVSVWHGVAKSSMVGLAVNDLIQWKGIQWAIEKGYKKYELMGADTPRLCEFKSKYSPNLDIHFILRKADFIGHLAERLYLLYRGRI